MKKTISLLIALLAVSFAQARDITSEKPYFETFSSTWKFKGGEGVDSLWMNADYNDNNWLDVSSKKLLKDQDAKEDNSFGWYRKNIVFSKPLAEAIQQSGSFALELGKFAACDEVYINGKLVGKTGRFPHDFMGYFDNERRYIVSSDVVNLDGDNTIAIKFHNGWGVGGFLGGTDLVIAAATTNDKLELDVKVEDPDYIFLGDTPISIVPTIQNNNKFEIQGKLVVTLTTDDYRAVKADSIDVTLGAKKSFCQVFDYLNPEPGFYRYTVAFKHDGVVACEKKFNVGYEPEKIVSPLDTQKDFKKFWDKSLNELSKVAPNYKLTLQPEHSKLDYDVYLVEMNSLGGEVIRGYYAQPKREGKFPVIVEYMGYGSAPYTPNQWWDGFAYFVLSTRGQGLNLPYNTYGTWITSGLENKDNYYYRGAFMDVVRAIDFVSSRDEIDSDKIAVRGGSQGGALSMAAASLDKRVKAAAPTITFLSDYPDYFKISPWPKSDFDNYMQQTPNAKWNDIYKTMSYFDIKNLAQWVTCPVLMGIGVQDNVCPPHTNFAGFNQVKSEKTWMAFPEFGHSVGREYHEEMMNFFREKLNVAKP